MNLAYTCHVRNKTETLDRPIVFVIDADAASRNALAAQLRSAGWLCQTAASVEQFLAQPRPLTPGCLLVELPRAGAAGPSLQQLVLERTELPVIGMSSRADVPAIVQAMKAGAIDVLTKPCISAVLLDAIGEAVERSYAELRRAAQIRALRDRYESLSRREREVMELVVSGRLNKQVGGELGISEITVKAHRGKLMRKMQAGSFADLVKMAARLSPAPSAAGAVDSLHGRELAFAARRGLGAVGAYGHA